MLVGSQHPLRVEAVQEYWLRNRVRMNAWNGMLTELALRISSPSGTRRAFGWQKMGSLIEEILLAEPLSRICVAVAKRLEDREIDADSCAIMHNVFSAHQEVRQRCLRWTLEGIDQGEASAHRLNRIRSYLEHWTDMLIGFFGDARTADEYAFSPDRVAEFAEDYSYRSLGDAAPTVWSLLLAGNRKWVSTHCSTETVFPKLSRDVCQAALGMVHPAWFDSLGLLPSRTAQHINHGLNSLDKTLESLMDGSWLEKSTLQIRGENAPREGRFSA